MADTIHAVVKLVRDRLSGAKGEWRAISEKTGVPYFTIANIHSGKSSNPTIGSLQPLLDHFGITVTAPDAANAP